MKVCSVEGCTQPVNARGWCSTHYSRWRKGGDPLVANKPVRPLCKAPGCSRPHNSHGYCTTHYQRLQKFGTLEPQRREKGTGTIHPSGYARITRNGVMDSVHRVVWEEAHGPLPPRWHVHHINGDTLDNRLENLIALSPRDHNRIHAALRKQART